ncbi:hypothetical protein GCM10011497_37400 [Elstera cyanobacteriorum]|uniref:RelA/SpoT domain-containing protein n=1 Tax=Elstera cyanobacteriorum TaxID=2022747 RepID=A0A255XY30_9PROT|nr:RelA/SpoT domain-containing protein [Elstera cyanobacteriorum]OYQ21140.1 hypothetical protein CHR90_02815 [Elstera cyanobacteriorum]GGA03334.1 hypothetical protein GCM10011497_37400 [Elstera cyanobacteriorum]
MDADKIKNEYHRIIPNAKRLNREIISQLSHVFYQENIKLGAPLESRVKSLESIQEKMDRKNLDIQNLYQINDLVGIRVILLFSRDLKSVKEIIETNFNVIEVENTADRLSESQFGYQSTHFTITLSQSWLSIPTFSGLDNVRVEIQVRTLSQHIWAVASHQLQYKNEESVPQTLKRNIHRISALLETVDLEFERILEDREKYIKSITTDKSFLPLNVDTLQYVLDNNLPKDNKTEDENYDLLLRELLDNNINSVKSLEEFISEKYNEAMDMEKSVVQNMWERDIYYETTKERIDKGVFFSHVGLIRIMLDN